MSKSSLVVTGEEEQFNGEMLREKVRKRFNKILEMYIELSPEEYVEWSNSVEQGIYDSIKSDMDFRGFPFDLDYNVSRKYTPKVRKGAKKEKTVIRYPVREIYRKIYWKVNCALTINSGRDDLIDRLCNGEFTPYELGFLSHEALDPNCFKAKYLKKKEEEEAGANQTRTWKDGKGRRGISIKIPYDIVEELDPVSGEVTGKKEVEVPDSMLTCGKCGMSKTTSYEMQTRSADEPMTVFASCLCCGNRWRC